MQTASSAVLPGKGSWPPGLARFEFRLRPVGFQCRGHLSERCSGLPVAVIHELVNFMHGPRLMAHSTRCAVAKIEHYFLKSTLAASRKHGSKMYSGK